MAPADSPPDTDAPPDAFIDITAERCPMTFVHTKLALGKLASGQVLEVCLCGAEPLDNVPRNAARLGHLILGLAPIDPRATAPDDPHRLLIRKKDKKG